MDVLRQCLVCPATFYVKPSVIKKGFGRFCSRACKSEVQKTSIMRVCPICTQSFKVFLSRIADERGFYCTPGCAGIGRAREYAFTHSVEDRFWSYVDKTSTPDGCWPWIGLRNKGGYGVFGVEGKNVVAHRYAFIHVHGPLPASIKVLHRCDNPPCCRDDHLFSGTQQDNVADMIAKGRARKARGEHAALAKLTPEQVQEIREAQGEIPGTVLAKRFNVSSTSIYCIFQRKSWKHIP